MKYLVIILLTTLFQPSAFSQENSNLSSLEKELCEIQYSLYELRHTFNGNTEDDNSYIDRLDSLQLQFEKSLYKLLYLDSTYKYEFTEIQKKDCRVIKSFDNKLRIFTQNTFQGGSNPMFCSYIQYVSKNTNHIQKMNGYSDPGYEYNMIYSIGNASQNLYLLSGITLIANCYFSEILQAISFKNQTFVKEKIFNTNDIFTDYLAISYQDFEEDATSYINESSKPCKILYNYRTKSIYKPIIKLTNGIEYISNEGTIYKEIINKDNNILFINDRLKHNKH